MLKIFQIFIITSRTAHQGLPRKKKPVKSNINCPECDIPITSPSCLARHLRSHNGEKPFKCESCEATFSQKGINISFDSNRLCFFEK